MTAASAATNVALNAAGDIRNETLSVVQNYTSANTSGSYTALSNQATIKAGGELSIWAAGDVTDVAGQINAGKASISAGRDISFETIATGSTYTAQVGVYSADNSSVTHALSQVATVGDLYIGAGRDLSLSGTQLAIGTGGSGNGSLLAGRDLTVAAVVDEVNTDQRGDPNAKQYDKQVHQDQTVVGAGIGASGTLSLAAGLTQQTTAVKQGIPTEDGNGTGATVTASAATSLAQTGTLTLNGSTVAAGGDLTLSASGDVVIAQVAEHHLSDQAHHSSSSSTFKKSSTTSADYSASSLAVGSSVSGDKVTITAGNDLNIAGSLVTAQDALALSAVRDVNVSSVEETSTEHHELEQKKSGFWLNLTDGIGYSKAAQSQAQNGSSSAQSGSVLSGGSVSVTAGRDVLVAGSTLVADADIRVDAARNLSIVSTQNSSSEESASDSKKSGFIGSFAQPAIGTVKSSQDGTGSSVTQVGSQIASLGGNVTLSAGEQYTQTSSQVLAPGGDIAITAKDVLINAAFDSASSSEHSQYSKVAIGGNVNIPIVNALQGLASLAGSAKDTGSGRMQALAAVTGVMQAQQVAAAASNVTGGIKVSVSLGSSKSESEMVQNSSTAVGSQIAAGGNLSIKATGGGEDSNLTAIGAELSAGNNVSLAADNAINLLAAENTSSQHSSNSSSGASIGIGYAMGGAQNGFTLELAANKAGGKADGDDLSYSNTHVSAGNQLTLSSGGDTNLKGAVVGGETVVADIGGDLNIESLQDKSTFDSKQNSAGFSMSLCIPPVCYGASSASLSVSKAKVEGDFLSVIEQSGIQAGAGGFQLAVAGNTDLIGGVISSSQSAIDAGKNSLSTGSLTYSELVNYDVYKASGFAMSATVSGQMGDQSGASDAVKNSLDKSAQGTPGATGGVGSASGSQGSATLSGISGGTITITNGAQQQALSGQDADAALAGIGRTVTTENSAALAGTLAQAWNGQQLLQEVQAQTAITQAFSAQAPKAIADFANQQYQELMAKAGDAVKGTPEYDALVAQADNWKEGGAYRVALHAVSGGLSGGLGGALGAGTIASAANLMNQFQDSAKSALEQLGMSADAAKLISQGLAEATSLGVGAIVGGTAGAATSLTVDTNNRQLHPDELAKLKELQEGKSAEEKQKLADAACALVRCAAGLLDSDPAKAALLAQQTRGESYIIEQSHLTGTGAFNYSLIDKVKDANSLAAAWAQEQLASAVRGAINLGYEILTNGPTKTPLSPFDLPSDLDGSDGPTTSGGVLVTTSPMVLCFPVGPCVIKDQVAIVPIPSNVIFSNGDGVGTNNDASHSSNSSDADSSVGSNDVIPGRVETRINVASGRTDTTPLRDNGNQVSA